MKDLALANVANTFLMHLIPNAQLEIIDDGYLFLVTRPDETTGIIETFVGLYRNRIGGWAMLE